MFHDLDMAVAEFMHESGFIATYIKREEGAYDPSLSETASIVTEIPVHAILMDLTLQSNGLTNKPNSLLQAGDKELYIVPPSKADPTEPALVVNASSDKVKVGNVVYDIVTHKELNTTGQNPILFVLYIRR